MERIGFEKDKKFRRSKMGNEPTVYNGIRFKSKLEARTAIMLDYWIKFGTIVDWQYEPQTFTFEHTDKTGKRKDVQYVPDFKVTFEKGLTGQIVQWWECKGFITTYDLLKWELFKENNPDSYFAVIFAGKLYPGRGRKGDISVFNYNKLGRIVDRVWENINQEFKKPSYKIL